MREQQAYSQKMAAHYSAQIETIDELLQAGEAKKVFRRSNLMYKKLIEQIISGPTANEYLGRSLALRAIAGCQLGRRDRGLWDWHVAIQLLPTLERIHLEVYGDAGSYLRDHPVRTSNSENQRLDSAEEVKSADCKPPRRKKGHKPVFPYGRRDLDQVVSVTVEVMIDTDGIPRDPVVIETAGELTLVAATLEAMREWEFEHRGVGMPDLERLQRTHGELGLVVVTLSDEHLST